MRCYVLLAMFASAAAQCGPGKSMPYPPGSSKCPSGPPGGGGGGASSYSTYYSSYGSYGGGNYGGGPGGGGNHGGPGGGGSHGGWGISCSSTSNVQASSKYIADTTTGAKGAPLRGNVGCVDIDVLKKRPTAENTAAYNVFGPMENGFSSSEPPSMSCLGSNSVDGGIDTHIAELMVARFCNKNPKTMGTSAFRSWANQVGGLDQCGGHASYHYHERLGYGVSSCAISTTDSQTGHSHRIATAADGKGIYGPAINGGCAPTDLDVCGGRWGVTPDSNGQRVYYYVVQPFAPFTVGCFGPPKATDKAGQMAECRALYSKCDGVAKTITTAYGTGQYDIDCPCFDPLTHANIAQTATGAYSRPGYLPPSPESPWLSSCSLMTTQSVVVVSGRNLRH